MSGRVHLGGTICLVFLVSVLGFGHALAAPPWDAPAFSADPAALWNEAAKIPSPEDSNVQLLLDETIIRFDEKGLEHRTSHRVFRCLTKDGVEQMSSVEATWAPWHQSRPLLRARLIDADRVVHTLDPTTAAEVPVEQEPQVLTDRRVLRAPLPALAVGVVAETETTVDEAHRFSECGTVGRAYLDGYWPTLRRRIVIEAPQSLKLRHEVRNSKAKAVETRKDGRLRIVVDHVPGKPLRAFETAVPVEEVRLAEVVYSTGVSWNDVATKYAAIVDKQIDDSRVKGFVREEIGKETDRKKIIAKLLRATHRLVRYTGLEFGEASIVPRSPTDILSRRYGDCKDMATLFVTMLRASGIQAHVALLSIEDWRETLPGHPGLDVFNHAIAYVPGPTPLWIDLTAEYYPSDRVPGADQGRLALVIDPSTRELTRIPRSSPGDSSYSERWTFDLTKDDARLEYRETTKGSYAAALRGRYSAANKDSLRKTWKRYFRANYSTDDIRRLEYRSLDDVSQPLVVELDVAKIKFPVHKESESEIAIVVSPDVLMGLPALFYIDTTKTEKEENNDESEDSGDRGKRRHPLRLNSAHVCEIEYHVIPPPGFSVATLPKEQTKKIGPASVTSRFVRLDDGSVRAVFRFDPGTGLFTAAEVEEFRSFIASKDEKDDLAHPRCRLVFKHHALEAMAAQDMQKAVAEHLATIKRYPKYAGERFRYANTLLKIGLGEAARAEARRGAELMPASAEMRHRLAQVLSHDLFGNLHGPTTDWQGAAAAYKESIKLDPTDPDVHFNYAVLLEYSREGRRYCSKRLDEAIDEYRAARKHTAAKELIDVNLGTVLMYCDRAKEVKDLNINASSPSALKGLLIAAVAATDGFAAADKKIEQLVSDPSTLGTVLFTAGDLLNYSRHYPAARHVYERAALQATGADKERIQKTANIMTYLRRIEPDASPQSLPARLICGLQEGESYAHLKPLLAAGTNETDLTILARSWTGGLASPGTREAFDAMPAKRVADSLALLLPQAEGKPGVGFRVVQIIGASKSATWFVAPERGEYRVVCSDCLCTQLGRVALAFLDTRKPAVARQWLTWGYDAHRSDEAWRDPFATSPFGQIWRMSPLEGEPNLRLAAAALMAYSTDPYPAIKVLLEERAKKGLDREVRYHIDRALVRAYRRTSQYVEALKTADRLVAAQRWAIEPWACKIGALRALGRQIDARRILCRQLASRNLPPGLEGLFAFYVGECGDVEAARNSYVSLIARYPKIDAYRIDLTWLLLSTGEAAHAKEAIRVATAARKGGRADPAEVFQAMAAAHAERGNASAASIALKKSLALRGNIATARDWYVLGRIAEEYGLTDVAKSLYGKVAPPAIPSATSPDVMVQRRLKLLDAK